MLFVLALLVCTAIQQIPQSCPPPQIISFQQFKTVFKRSYNASQQPLRRSTFDQNVAKLLQNPCCACGITKFFDWTDQQFNNMRGLREKNQLFQDSQLEDQAGSGYLRSNLDHKIQLKLSRTPSSLDWRKQNAVTPAKNQKDCGTCWSFATVGFSQSWAIIHHNSTPSNIDLSEQSLLRCTPGSTCDGGYLEDSLDRALDNGLPYEAQYSYNPYNTSRGVCQASNVLKISELGRDSRYDVSDSTIIQMLQTSPITAAVSSYGWRYYSRGIMYCPSLAKIDHAVLLIGYTPDAWIAKNSWGTDYGDNGIIYISRRRGMNCRIGRAVHSIFQPSLSVPQWLLMVFIMIIILQ